VTASDYRGTVKRIVIAGGIGAGKSAVAQRLRDLGFVVVDADDVAHDVTAPGSPTLATLVDAFGSAVLDREGALDRAFVAEVVFHDPTALRRLNSITHGAIGVEIVRRLDEADGDVVFAAIPLFRPEHRAAFALDSVWSVQVSPETAIRRLVNGRGFNESDARARLATQMSNDERAAIVDRVLWNEGTVDELYAELDAALAETGLSRG
jgi:dephospho-CoA kinase